MRDTALAQLAQRLHHARHHIGLIRRGGQVIRATASEYAVTGLPGHAKIGDCVELECGDRKILGELISISLDGAIIQPFASGTDIGLGHPAWLRRPIALAPSRAWQGRILDALGCPIDGLGPVALGTVERSINSLPPDALQRQRVTRAIKTGVKVIDIFTPLCAGQRIGIFAGSGVGKSTLLGMLARSPGFDRIVVALVGERGREVREFIEDILGPRRSSTVMVIATGNESPMMRRQAPRTAMTIAEHFRDQGESVLLIVDSITRYAHALREVALAAGEPPVARGYTPSVFAELPRLLERAGPGAEHQGTITGIFSVLVDGDDHNEPVADTVRGILDGHIVLTRDIAARGQYPAVDVLQSISRLSDKAWTPEEARLAKRLVAMVAEYEGTRDLRLLGAYKAGENVELDRAVAVVPRVYSFLTQSPETRVDGDPFAELARHLAIVPS